MEMLNPKRFALLLRNWALILWSLSLCSEVFVLKLLSSELCISIILNIHFHLSTNISPYNISIHASQAATSYSRHHFCWTQHCWLCPVCSEHKLQADVMSSAASPTVANLAQHMSYVTAASTLTGLHCSSCFPMLWQARYTIRLFTAAQESAYCSVTAESAYCSVTLFHAWRFFSVGLAAVSCYSCIMLSRY